MKIVTGYTGEKHITSADDQGFNAGIVGNGLYVLPIGSQFALTYSGTTVTIADGEGVLQGVHFRAESESLTVSNPSSGYRCTVIYVRYTKTSGVESVGLYTKAGSAATSESAVVVPTVTSGNIRNGATLAEAVLFRVYSNTSGIYKTEMAADVVSSLASLTSGVSALNSKLNTMAVIANNYDTTGASGTTQTYNLDSGAIYLVVVGKLNTGQNTSGVYIAIAHSYASSLIPLNEAGAAVAVVSIDKLVLSVEYKTTYTRTTVIRLG